MTFAIASLAGAGTVSIAANATAVVGTGTAFVSGDVGKQFIVGSAWGFISVFTSATSITLDRALSTSAIVGQAYLTAPALGTITQTGTDNGVSALVFGATKTAILPTLTTIDLGANVLQVNGTFTINSLSEKITKMHRIAVGEGALFHVQGQTTTANPTMMPGIEAQCSVNSTNAVGGLSFSSTNAASPGVIRVTDANLRWSNAPSSGPQSLTCGIPFFGKVQTRGTFAGFFRANTTGDQRIFLPFKDYVLDFQAAKTVMQFQLYLAYPQVNMIGLVPYACDGPEITTEFVTVAPLVIFDSYDYSAVVATSYAEAKFILTMGPYIRHKNLSGGTTMVTRWQGGAAGTGYGTIEFSRVVQVTFLSGVGTPITTGRIVSSLSAGPINAQPKGFASPISYPAENIVANTNGSGVATAEFIYAVARAIYTGAGAGITQAASAVSVYRCAGQTPGAETNPVAAVAYGYTKTFAAVPMQGAGDFEYVAAPVSLATTDKNESAAAAIAGIAINFGSKAITISQSQTTQLIFDKLQYFLVKNENAFVIDTSSFVNNILDLADFSLTLSAGTISQSTIKTTGLVTLLSGSSITTALIAPISNAGTLSGTITGNVTNNGTLASGASITGNLTQNTPTNMSGVTVTGDLIYAPTVATTITLTNVTHTGNIINAGTAPLVVVLAGTTTVGTAGANISVQVLCSVAVNGGNTFNLVKRYGSTGSYTDLGYSAGLTSDSFLVPKGQPVEVAIWTLGFLTFTRTIQTTNGGFSLLADMIPEPDMDTSLDVSAYLSNISVTYATGAFTATFNANMSVPGIEPAKAILHRLLGLEGSMRALLPPGMSTTVDVEPDEIQINKPAVFLVLGSGATDVSISGFFNTGPAKVIDPAYIINPRRVSDNLRVEIPLVKPALDVAALAAAVRTELATELARIDVATSTRSKPADVVDANIVKINDKTIQGSGVAGDSFKPV
jgi:hypothetical protein